MGDKIWFIIYKYLIDSYVKHFLLILIHNVAF
jgi:hypothetical protein